jgi:hypothetical protein
MEMFPYTVELADPVTGDILWSVSVCRAGVSVPWPRPDDLGCDRVDVHVTFADGTTADIPLRSGRGETASVSCGPSAV